MTNSSFLFFRVLNRIKVLHPISVKLNSQRHKMIMRKLEPRFKQSLIDLPKNNYQGDSKASQIIWFFWWQGKQNMPLLVQKCYDSVCRQSGKYRVILVTKFNIHKYVTLPEYIYSKLAKGSITYTHFSDIVRFNLLHNYGGLWLDSTCFATNRLDQLDISKSIFTVSNYDPQDNMNVSCGRWTGFLMGGPANSELFTFMDEFFLNYWQTNNQLLDFFLIDYALSFAWKYDLSNLQEISKQNNGMFSRIFDLQANLSKPYDDPEVTSLLKSSTFIFKLTNRKKINHIDDSSILFNHLDTFNQL